MSDESYSEGSCDYSTSSDGSSADSSCYDDSPYVDSSYDASVDDYSSSEYESTSTDSTTSTDDSYNYYYYDDTTTVYSDNYYGTTTETYSNDGTDSVYYDQSTLYLSTATSDSISASLQDESLQQGSITVIEDDDLDAYIQATTFDISTLFNDADDEKRKLLEQLRAENNALVQSSILSSLYAVPEIININKFGKIKIGFSSPIDTQLLRD